jgi:protein transport protein SEC39
MSSYSLTLQHGVPFQPVSIRVSSDPISLIEKILAQNPGSYVRLQDLVSIGTNFVLAGLTFHSHDESLDREPSQEEVETAKVNAQRRVIGMAIEAALNEDDFETAYSYVVNWLDTSSSAARTSIDSKRPSSRVGDEKTEDDIAWRAALAAGRHKSMSASTTVSAPPALRRLEQRMELLSQALLLAPSTALPEVLSAWRRCEEEMSILLADETPEVESVPSGIPGAFMESSIPSQMRREVGRGASEEAPVGLFDVARGAAAAFSKSAFPLRAVAESARSGSAAGSIDQSSDQDNADKDRVRRRDMVASAVTGGLASGLGWVLGE